MTIISFYPFAHLSVLVLSLITKIDAATVTVYAVDPPAWELPSGLPTGAPYSVEAAGTEVWSAVGTLESGVTKYELKEIQSVVVLHGATETITRVSAPTTRTYTVEQGGAIHREAVDPYIRLVTVSGTLDRKKTSSGSGFKQDCQMDTDKKKAACVYELLNPELIPTVVGGETVGATRTHTFTTTYTGNVYPVATLATGGAKGLAVVTHTSIAAVVAVLFGLCAGVYVV